MGKPYCLHYHFLLLQNKFLKTDSVYTTRFASTLSCAFHSYEPNVLSPDAFYDLKMHQNVFAAGTLPLTLLGSLQHSSNPIAG